MKRSRLFLIALVVFSAAAGGWYLSAPDKKMTSGRLPTIGSVAPDFQLVDTDGDVRSLSSERGKVVLVNFWATWCPPCKAEMPSMEQLYQKNYSRGNFEIFAINVDDDGPAVMPAFLAKTPHSFPIVFDTGFQARTQYGVSMFPETFIVDRNGIINRKIIGAIDWTSPEILSYLDDLMGGN